jgi:hypothetical protein
MFQFDFLVYVQKAESKTPKRYLYVHIPSSTVHSSQMVVQLSIKMDKHNVLYTYKWILSSLKKEGSSDVCYHMDETWEHEISPSQKDKSTYIRNLE